jgi:dihydroorotate dehydrogenase electron transfer subunit
MLRPGRDWSHLLRKPFSIADAEGERVSFLGKVVGPGTERLAAKRPGETVQLLGPLGTPFRWEEGRGRLHVLVAGGIGIAPFPLLARRLRAAGEEALLLYGARRAEDLAGADIVEALGAGVRTIVETGSGRTGLVTELLEEVLAGPDAGRARAYSCGPRPMLKAVGARLRAAGVPHQAALEEYMGCGFGVCLGCAVPVRRAGGVGYVRCCMEGPVFDYGDLAW